MFVVNILALVFLLNLSRRTHLFAPNTQTINQ